MIFVDWVHTCFRKVIHNPENIKKPALAAIPLIKV